MPEDSHVSWTESRGLGQRDTFCPPEPILGPGRKRKPDPEDDDPEEGFDDEDLDDLDEESEEDFNDEAPWDDEEDVEDELDDEEQE